MLAAMSVWEQVGWWFIFAVFCAVWGVMKGAQALGGGNGWAGAKKGYTLGRGIWRMFG